jgi:hypothetical protein
MANWNDLKSTIESEIKKSEISNKEVIKLIFNLERRLNTCRNFLTRNSWESMYYNLKAFNEARAILQNLQENYTSDYNKHCDANNTSRGMNLGDMLC